MKHVWIEPDVNVIKDLAGRGGVEHEERVKLVWWMRNSVLLEWGGETTMALMLKHQTIGSDLTHSHGLLARLLRLVLNPREDREGYMLASSACYSVNSYSLTILGTSKYSEGPHAWGQCLTLTWNWMSPLMVGVTVGITSLCPLPTAGYSSKRDTIHTQDTERDLYSMFFQQSLWLKGQWSIYIQRVSIN